MISGVKKCIALLLTLLCILTMYLQAVFAAEETSQHETVKVGFFAMDGYHMMDENGNRLTWSNILTLVPSGFASLLFSKFAFNFSKIKYHEVIYMSILLI